MNKKVKHFPKHPKFPQFVDKIVNIYTYSAVIALVIYMLFSLTQSLYFVIDGTFWWSGNAPTIKQEDILHTVALTIVLVKAYKVLLEYAKTQHINIKYIIEIAIIAPTIEIIFNPGAYDLAHIIFMWIFSTIMTILYLFFYNTLKKVDADYERDYEKICNEYKKYTE